MSQTRMMPPEAKIEHDKQIGAVQDAIRELVQQTKSEAADQICSSVGFSE